MIYAIHVLPDSRGDNSQYGCNLFHIFKDLLLINYYLDLTKWELRLYQIITLGLKILLLLTMYTVRAVNKGR